MRHADVILPVHRRNDDVMRRVRFFGFQRRQQNAAAVESALAGGRDHIAANRADVKPGFQHITGAVLVHDLCPGKQLRHGDVQRLCQRLQQHNIRQPFSRLPLGNGLVADADALGELRLRQMLFFAQRAYRRAGYIIVHGVRSFFVDFFCAFSITGMPWEGNLRCGELLSARKMRYGRTWVFFVLYTMKVLWYNRLKIRGLPAKAEENRHRVNSVFYK